MTSLLPTEWEFEAADPEVGFLSDTVTHTCQENLDDAEPAEVTDVSFTGVTVHGEKKVAETTTFGCPVCKATTAVTEHWPIWYFEAGL